MPKAKIKANTGKSCPVCGQPIYRFTEMTGSVFAYDGEVEVGNVYVDCRCHHSAESLGTTLE